MATAVPSRLIYMLSWDERRRMVCALYEGRMLNWKVFRPVEIRRLSHMLAPGRFSKVEPGDRRILPRLVQYESPTECEAVLSDADGFMLLREIVETGRAFLLKGNQLRVEWGRPRPAQPVWKTSAEGLDQPEWETVPACDHILATTPPCYVGTQGRFDTIGPLETDWSAPAARAWAAAPLPDEQAVERYLALFINRHPEAIPPPRPGSDSELMEDCPPVPVLRVVRRESGSERTAGAMLALEDILLLRLHFRYGTKEISWTDERDRIAFSDDGRTRCCQRHGDTEAAVLERLKTLGFERRQGGGNRSLFDFHLDDFQLRPDAGKTWDGLLREVFPGLKAEGWKIARDTDTDLEVVAEDSWSRQVEEQEGGWHTFEAVITYHNRRIAVLPLLRDFLRAHCELSNEELAAYFERASFAIPARKDGRLLIVPGTWLRSLFDAFFELGFDRSLDRSGRLTLSRWRARELAAGEHRQLIVGERMSEDAGPGLERLRERLRGGDDSFAPPDDLPAGLDGLRDYQRSALGWLDFLRETETHGVLADDMGLGKTFQVLAHLWYEKSCGRLEAPALVVCPTSVIGNWIEESRLRTPGLRLHRHHGPQRHAHWHASLESHDVIVTSYALLREDAEALAGMEWSFVILDEAQSIKNRQSRTFEAATGLRAARRLCLTGTPVENHLGELWALFHFLMPFYLGRYDQFREEFQKTIAQAESDRRLAEERARLLSRRLAPFILRRKKKSVARELPPKTEITHVVDLAPLQAQRYEGVRLRLVREIRTIIEERSLAQSQINVLDALMRLRLICCDPRIGSEGDPSLAAEHSAKFERLFELLEELMDEGRRILVFSQFVSMLDLIESEIESRSWRCLKLTGQTIERGAMVDAFNAGAAPIFLMSLKAGGVGLNLATADNVILYDPWWNPAVEAQATDRAHRIGQLNPVFVHRLIARGTVEEGMLQLHERKREVVERVLDGLPGDRLLLDEEALEALFGEAL